MYYFVTLSTDVGRQLNHLRAKDREQAKKIVSDYNSRHPDWNMRLLKRKGTNLQSKLETRLFRKVR